MVRFRYIGSGREVYFFSLPSTYSSSSSSLLPPLLPLLFTFLSLLPGLSQHEWQTSVCGSWMRSSLVSGWSRCMRGNTLSGRWSQNSEGGRISVSIQLAPNSLAIKHLSDLISDMRHLESMAIEDLRWWCNLYCNECFEPTILHSSVPLITLLMLIVFSTFVETGSSRGRVCF